MMSTQPTAPAHYPVAKVAAQLAARVARQARPLSPQVHLVPGAGNPQLLVVNGSRLFSLPAATATRFEDLLRTQDEAGLSRELAALGLDAPAFITDAPLQSPPVYALSLAIAQKCNMGCTYCYAGGGDFGGPTKSMPLPTALRAIDLLLEECPEGGKVQLTFLGVNPCSTAPPSGKRPGMPPGRPPAGTYRPGSPSRPTGRCCGKRMRRFLKRTVLP